MRDNYICLRCGSTFPKGNGLPCPMGCDAKLEPMAQPGDRVKILWGINRGRKGKVLRYTHKGSVRVRLGPCWYSTLQPHKVRRVKDV